MAEYNDFRLGVLMKLPTHDNQTLFKHKACAVDRFEAVLCVRQETLTGHTVFETHLE
jgi:hypothetical protein